MTSALRHELPSRAIRAIEAAQHAGSTRHDDRAFSHGPLEPLTVL